MPTAVLVSLALTCDRLNAVKTHKSGVTAREREVAAREAALAEKKRREKEAHDAVERYKKAEAERAQREREEAEERDRAARTPLLPVTDDGRPDWSALLEQLRDRTARRA